MAYGDSFFNSILRKNTAVFEAFNVATGQMLRGLDSGGVRTAPKAYLATFRYRASGDAAGTFVIDVLHDAASNHGSFLVSDFTRPIDIRGSEPAVIEVQQQAAGR